METDPKDLCRGMAPSETMRKVTAIDPRGLLGDITDNDQEMREVEDVGGAPDAAADGEWVTYPYREAHPILRWLPSKLAEWIGDNYGAALGIPPKHHADGWTVGELNAILDNNLDLTTLSPKQVPLHHRQCL